MTGGSDQHVRVWVEDQDTFKLEQSLQHEDSVLSVNWASNIGLSIEMVVSCSEDGVLRIWKQDDKSNVFDLFQQETQKDGLPFWKAEWSPVGHMLAVSQGDNEVTVYTQDQSGLYVAQPRVGEEVQEAQQ